MKTSNAPRDLFLPSADLGGMMGLLLGASVMTVCEVLDLLFYNGIMKFYKKQQQSGRVSSMEIVVSEKKEIM